MSDDAPSGPGPRRRRIIWLAAAVAAGVMTGFLFLPAPGPGPEAGAGAAAGDAATTVAAPARVQALGEVLPVTNILTVAAPTGQDVGRIAEIRFAEGDTVAAGDILAVLDTEPLLKSQLDQASSNVSVKQAALAAKAADLEAQEAQLAAEVRQLQIARDKAKIDLDRMTQLRDTGLYEDAALVEKRLDVESAGFNLKNLEVQLERTRARTADGVRLDEASARAELDAAVAAARNAEVSYGRAFVKAPVAGRILTITGRIGEQIGQDGFAQMGDTTAMSVRAEVYETDIGTVTPGQGVSLSSRALDTRLRGTVERIGVRIKEQSILSTDPAAIVDARVIEVWIRLDADSSKATANLSGLQVVATFDAEGEGDA